MPGVLKRYDAATSSWIPTIGAPADVADLLHVRDEKASGTNGGATTTGSWLVRTLNTVVTNEIAGASLAANVITLPAGTYEVAGRAPSFRGGAHKCRLYNVTDASVVVHGASAQSDSGSTGAQSDSVVSGRFTLASSKDLRLEHRFTAAHATHGMGHSSAFGDTEIYADVMIRKVS